MSLLATLVYRSTHSAPLTPSALHVLVEKARIRNKSARVTGALLYDGTQFMQCLEGPPLAVAALYDSITRDARHQRLKVLFNEPVGSREFPDWAMAFVPMSEEDRQAAMRTLGLAQPSAARPAGQLLAHFLHRSARPTDCP